MFFNRFRINTSKHNNLKLISLLIALATSDMIPVLDSTGFVFPLVKFPILRSAGCISSYYPPDPQPTSHMNNYLNLIKKFS